MNFLFSESICFTSCLLHEINVYSSLTWLALIDEAWAVSDWWWVPTAHWPVAVIDGVVRVDGNGLWVKLHGCWEVLDFHLVVSCRDKKHINSKLKPKTTAASSETQRQVLTSLTSDEAVKKSFLLLFLPSVLSVSASALCSSVREFWVALLLTCDSAGSCHKHKHCESDTSWKMAANNTAASLAQNTSNKSYSSLRSIVLTGDHRLLLTVYLGCGWGEDLR